MLHLLVPASGATAPINLQFSFFNFHFAMERSDTEVFMSRRKRAEIRNILPDYRYNSVLVHKFINCLMMDGKKSVAQRILYQAIEGMEANLGKPGIEVFNRAVDNVKPAIEVRPKRVGGATYQVPTEVRKKRQTSLALRWIIDAAVATKGKPMSEKLKDQLISAYKKEGNAIKRKEEVHRMAEANRVFAQFKW